MFCAQVGNVQILALCGNILNPSGKEDSFSSEFLGQQKSLLSICVFFPHLSSQFPLHCFFAPARHESIHPCKFVKFTAQHPRRPFSECSRQTFFEATISLTPSNINFSLLSVAQPNGIFTVFPSQPHSTYTQQAH